MGVSLFGQEHVGRYRETDGEEGHDWHAPWVLRGGDPLGWFLNPQDGPIVAVQVKADHHTAGARVATAVEKPELWCIVTATGAPYDGFQAKAARPFDSTAPER